ncbi:hypothetical protein LY76DRAFT_335152 [Colletotrichum caudatum]|nr:hypothetical protein LY76DRAFT_335152 [Colletotrichum caudatum]
MTQTGEQSTSSTDTASTMNPRPYSLPGVSKLSPEDDWTGIENRKEKKKLQNRVAQRVYRHRMKERIKMLQDRLEYHETQRDQNAVPVPADPPLPNSSSGGVTDDTMTYASSTMMPNTVDPHQSHLYSTAEKSTLAQFDILDINQEPPPRPAAMDCGDGIFFGGDLMSPEHHLAAPVVTDIDGGEWSGDMSQDFMLKCLCMQSQMLDKLKTTREKTPLPDAQPQDDGRTAPSSSSGVAFSPANDDEMYFEFGQIARSYKSDGLFYGFPQHQPGQRGNVPHTPGSSVSSGPNRAAEPAPAAGEQDARATASTGAPPLEERLGSVMDRARAAGFGSFDELVMAYYGGQLGESSPLANEQRLSRNRRLPRVVSDVFHRASGWSVWERRGFHEELLKIAETMLTSEGASVRAALVADIRPMMVDGGDREKTCLRLKRMVQDLVPNLWALNSALVANDGARSNAALGSILLMHCAGRMPKGELLGLLEMCL